MSNKLEDFYNKIADEQDTDGQFMHPWANLSADEQYGFARKLVSETAGFANLATEDQAVKVYDFAADSGVDVGRVNLSAVEQIAITSAAPKVAAAKFSDAPVNKGISAADPVTQKAAADKAAKK